MTAVTPWRGSGNDAVPGTHGARYPICRCSVCKAGARQSQREWKHSRRTERVEVDGRFVHPDAPHGTLTGYTSWSCQCPGCTKAGAAYRADVRARTDEALALAGRGVR